MSVNYIRLNAPPIISNCYCGLVSSDANLINEKEYIIHFKCISYKPSNIVVRFKKKDNTEITLGQFNIESCEVLKIVNNKNEYYCILKFKSTITAEGNILIGTNIDDTYIANEKILDIREVALQKGELLLPYTQGAIDLGKEFSELNTKIEQLADSISLKASKVETNSMEERVSSAELKISPNQIITTVMESNKFTEFKHGIDNFQFQIKQGINSTNVVRNGNFKNGYNHWNGHQTDSNFYWDVYNNYESYGFNGRSVLSMKNTNWYSVEKSTYSHSCYEVEKNTDYTLNFHYCVEKNIQECRVFLILSNTLEGDNAKVHSVLRAPGGQQSDLRNDIPHTFKFNTENYKYVWIRFDNLGMRLNSEWQTFNWFSVADVAIYKGDVGAIKFLQNPNESYGNVVRIDGDQVRCDFENGAYNLIGRKGNRWYAPGMEYPYHFLSHHEAVSITTDGTNNYITRDIKLPARFDYVNADEISITSSLKGWYKYKGEMFALESISVSTANVYRNSDGTYAQVAAYGHIRRSSDFGSEGLQVNVTLHVTA